MSQVGVEVELEREESLRSRQRLLGLFVTGYPLDEEEVVYP